MSWSIETLAKRIGLPVSMGELKVEHRPARDEEVEFLCQEKLCQVVQLSRVILAEGRPVAYLIDILPEDILPPQDIETGFTGSVLDLLLERGSLPLATSRTEINAVTATHDVARSLGIQRGDVLLRFVACLYTATNRIVDYSFSYFLPGYFKFHIIRRVGK